VLSGDFLMMFGLGMAMCAFLVRKGVVELFSFLMIPVAYEIAVKMKASLPPEALMVIAGAICISGLLFSKDSNTVVFFLLLGIVGCFVMLLKLFIPIYILVRLSMTVVFLGLIRVLVF